MGLASLLKRKLGKDSQNGASKKSKPAVPISRATALEIANLKSKSTRTARRKLKKFGALADQPLPDYVNGTTARDTSDDEDGDADAEDTGADIGELATESRSAGGAGSNSRAYEALLSSLAATNEAMAGAVDLRRRELAGDSDLESEESDEEEEEDDSCALSEEEEDEDEEDENDIDIVSHGKLNNKRNTADKDEISEEEEEEEVEDDYEEEEEEEAPVQTLLSKKQNGAPSTNITAPGGSQPLEDHFDTHLEAQLSEDTLAKLATASSTPFIDIPNQDDDGKIEKKSSKFKKKATSAISPSSHLSTSLNAWFPDTKIQASEGASITSSAPLHLKDYGVRERLITRWREIHSQEQIPFENNDNTNDSSESDFASHKQRALFSLLSSYCDILNPCRGYPTSVAMDAPDPDMDAVLLHVINHVARSSDRIKKNNEKLQATKEKERETRRRGGGSGGDKITNKVDDINNEDDDDDGVPRDQGFARPKVLFLLPMRSTAMRLVSRLLKLALKETRVDSIQNKERFLEEFGTGEEDEDIIFGGKDENGGKNEGNNLTAREKAAIARKPLEHRALFAGNLDDHFRLGMKITRGAVRLYTDFYQSDVLVASPLALATKLSEDERDGAAGAADFLSSIEIVVLERADVLQMQNWTHVTTVLDALNKMPSQQRDVDIMRVREWMLSGQARHYRQTIVLSSFPSAEMNALVVRKCSNHSGRIRLTQVNYPGVLRHIVPQVRQIYERLNIPSGSGPAGDADARFENFKSVVWPRIRETARGGGQLIYIPSYFDFVRVRNFLRAESASFLGLCEYTERADMARARSYFADGRRRVLVYTERAQFYNRHRIRGVKDILFYQLPEHPQFYSELVNFLEEENTPGVGLATATVMYSKYDVLRLERVVGSERAKMMMKKKNGTFLFC